MNVDKFKKQFNMPDNLYKIISDGNTSSMKLNDINSIPYNITFNKKGFPIIKKIESELYSVNDIKVNGVILRSKINTDKKENIIYKYLKDHYLN